MCDAQLLHQTSRDSLNLPMQCLFAHMPLNSTLQPAILSVKSSSQFQSNENCVYFNLAMLTEKPGLVLLQRHSYICSNRSHRHALYLTGLQQQKDHKEIICLVCSKCGKICFLETDVGGVLLHSYYIIIINQLRLASLVIKWKTLYM